MRRPVFEHRDYKDYLRDRVEAGGRGEKSRLAEVLRCHSAYVSQILNGQAQLSLEQADALNGFFAHTEEEGDFFLLLVSHARAGTVSLRRLYDRKIRHVLQERTLLANRVKGTKTVPEESQVRFYSAWYYAAIHLLISIPEFQTKEALARRLRLPMSKISEVLEFLVSSGLARQAEGRYLTGEVQLYMKGNSPLASRHHASWRMQAMSSLDRETPEELHYTGIVSIARADLPEVRKILVEAIEKVRAVVRKSPEEVAYCYLLDLFEV